MSSRYIKFFEKPIDISVIEIKDSDEINKEDIEYLYRDLNYKEGGYLQYKEMDILSLGYPFGDKLATGSGKIKNIIKYEFEHNIPTEQGSSGSPIILFNLLRVIGIHKYGDLDKNINIGTFIGVILNEINSDIKIEKNKNDKRENKIKNNKINNLNKNPNFDSLIKRNKSLSQNNIYINFKDDNILNKNNDSNKGVREEIFSKMFKKKNDLFNDSNRNSMQSDFSDIHLNKQSIEIIDNNKNNEIKLEENKKKVKFLNNFKKLSTKTNLSYFSNKRESYNSLGSNKKGSQKESTINPIKISKLKNIMNLNKNIDDLKKNETIKSKRKSLYISKALKANVNFKFLKEQL